MTVSRTSSTVPVIAVLGAGIMGCSVALFLARKGAKVVLFEAAPSAFTGASRWNEGKIHLGYLYGADPSLATARRLLPGGLVFPRLLEELIGHDIRDLATPQDDVMLVHRRSIVSADEAFQVANRVADLARGHPDANEYFVALENTRPVRLSQTELEASYDTHELIAGYRVPERSVRTQILADYFVEAVNTEPGIDAFFNCRVVSVRECSAKGSAWRVQFENPEKLVETSGPFNAVVNALWQGRGVVDASVGIHRSSSWTHRYRVSLFARSSKQSVLKSAVVSVGPFGDVKNYDGRNLYFSWYKAGLLAESNELLPPSIPELNASDRKHIADQTLSRLSLLMPEIRDLRRNLEVLEVQGGWVYAAGEGPLDDTESDLHRRDEVGVVRRGSYFSVDTGKYSIAPWLGLRVADAVMEIA